LGWVEKLNFLKLYRESFASFKWVNLRQTLGKYPPQFSVKIKLEPN
jgi:hypothetical protein